MNTELKPVTDKEQQLTLELLQAIDNKDDISQRHLAQQMGVALGLANSYLKRCVKKGLVKIKTAPANRYLYYLTPHGFAEKARLTGEFLSTSLALFRQSGDSYSEIFEQCEQQQQKKLLFIGLSDLTEIAYMRALQSEIEVLGVFHMESAQQQFFDLPVFNNIEQLPGFDALIFTSLEQTQSLLTTFETIAEPRQLKLPAMLLNMQYRNPALSETDDSANNHQHQDR